MNPPREPSHKFEEFIKKRKDQIVTVLKGDFWVIKKRRSLKWLFVCLCSPTLIGMMLVFVLLLGFFGAIGFMYFYDSNLKDNTGKPINWNKIRNGDFNKSTIIRDQNGQIIDRFFFEIRDPIKPDEIPALLADAFIAAEDENFWLHPGIDPTAIGRAFVGNILRRFGINWWASSGASTITQQLVRLVYSEERVEFQRRDHAWGRKIREIHFAIQLEKRYTKKAILAAFLNYIYFGHGRYGAREACRYYFGHDNLRSLTPRQVAELASMNKGPTKYCPIFHEPPKPVILPSTPDEIKALIEKEYENKRDKEKLRISRTRERNNWALYQLREEGYISNQQYHASLFNEKENLTELVDLKITPLRDPAVGYANRMVKEALLGMGYEDEEITHYGGYRITTCLDERIQQILNEEFTQHLAELNNEIKDKSNPVNGSGIVTDIETGCIVGLVGGYDYDVSKYNRALATRSMGSLAKVPVYVAALEAGMGFFDPVCNCPFSKRGADGKPWRPENFPEKRPVPRGYNPLAVGLIRSVNLQTLNLAQRIGMDRIVDVHHRLGIWGNRGIVKDPNGKIVFRMPNVKDQGDKIIPLLPTAIGASDGNIIEWAYGIATLMRGGNYLPPRLVLEVRDSEGKILYKAPEPTPQKTIEEDIAQKIVILMRAVTKEGTTKISMRGIDQEAAAKTGTSNDPDEKDGIDGPGDVSLVSMTPKHLLLIRLGHDQLTSMHFPQYMKRVSGDPDQKTSAGWLLGFVSRRIWDRIHSQKPPSETLNKLYLNLPKTDFPIPIEEGLAELLANYPDRYK